MEIANYHPDSVMTSIINGSITTFFWCNAHNKWHELKDVTITFTDCSISGTILPKDETRLGLIFKLIKSFF